MITTTTFCKYCKNPIGWMDRKPHNADGTAHTFDYCQNARKEAKKAEKQAKIDDHRALHEKIQDRFPIGTYVAHNIGVHLDILRPYGRVVEHKKFFPSKGAGQHQVVLENPQKGHRWSLHIEDKRVEIPVTEEEFNRLLAEEVERKELEAIKERVELDAPFVHKGKRYVKVAYEGTRTILKYLGEA